MRKSTVTTICPNGSADRSVRAVMAAGLPGPLAISAALVKGLAWFVLIGLFVAWHCLYRRQIERLADDLRRSLEP